MIANLPLLFANGNPKSLKKITAEELEKFITFMVTCSWGHDTVKDIREPPWWPTDIIPFSHPFVRPPHVPMDMDWLVKLRHLVKCCYDHHKSTFLLVFSSQLSRYARYRLRYVDNRDHTTSLYHRPSGRLLVTFRNENIFYDRDAPVELEEPQSKPADIYLCDNCDSHFDNFDLLKAHERLCNAETSASTSYDGGLLEFLSALKLQTVSYGNGGLTAVKNNQNDVRPRNIRSAANIDRGPPYPFSSLAYMRNAKTNVQRDTSYSRERMERYCCAPFPVSKPLASKSKNQQFPIRYRRPIDYWHRKHTFPNQRKKKVLDLKGQLLLLKCRPVTIDVERMTMKQMQECIDHLKKEAEKVRMEDKDIIFVDGLESDQMNIADMRSADPLKRADGDCEVIDLCSDDESPSVNENCDPRAGIACVMRGGAVLRRTAATPLLLPAEPCGARQRPLSAAVLQPHPVILIAHTLNNLQTISLE